MFSVKINNKRFTQFKDFSVTLNYGAIASSFAFSAFFDSSLKDHRELFKRFAYQRIEIFHGNKLLLTGTVIGHSSKSEAKKTLISISGYSKTGVLEDCMMPRSVYPLQFEGLDMRQIFTKVLSKFGIALVVDSNVEDVVSIVYDSVECRETQTIKSFFTELATQRNLVLSHTNRGDVRITRANTNLVPVQHFSEGMTGTNISVVTNGQSMFSTVYAIKEQDFFTDNTGDEETPNPLVSEFRPITIKQTVGDDNNTFDVGRNALNKMIKSAINVSVDTDRVTWVNGQLMDVNQIITVLSPENQIYKTAKLFVESVTLKQGNGADTAQLKCVLPECYNNEPIKNIFA